MRCENERRETGGGARNGRKHEKLTKKYTLPALPYSVRCHTRRWREGKWKSSRTKDTRPRNQETGLFRIFTTKPLPWGDFNCKAYVSDAEIICLDGRVKGTTNKVWGFGVLWENNN
ncbi:hypothetical protein EVAR_58471_1 [Eumeta japonica]|uniref:Uncharacterized protein n=1 Tax=Eumeta variegata TaxID=151549 RepID=A0A4C1YQR6_EUMVA|nr:hypothetical protein EVAR_58471_1 [Eumeta japonica]